MTWKQNPKKLLSENCHRLFDTLKGLRGVQIPEENYLHETFLHVTLSYLISVFLLI